MYIGAYMSPSRQTDKEKQPMELLQLVVHGKFQVTVCHSRREDGCDKMTRGRHVKPSVEL